MRRGRAHHSGVPWLLALPIVLLALTTAQAHESARVTTENAEYCELLAQRLAASPSPVPERPRDLGEEGQRLCATGHLRAGIAKLRRALRATRAETQGG